VTFDQAISGASWTPPSMSSIFSGIYPHQLGMYNFDASYPDGVNPIFSRLDDFGYEVGSFVFDEENLFCQVPSANVIDNFRDYEQPKQWIRDHSDDDFFLFVHHYWVHGPYEPKDSAEAWSQGNEEILQRLRENHEESVEWCKNKYSKAVERMSEEWLAGLLEVLEECEIDDDTIIIFTGDHGEGWGERYDDPEVMKTNFHLHGKLLYDEHIRVPLVVDDPSSEVEGTTVDEQVRHIDIVPTLEDLLDLDIEADFEFDGKSFSSALRGKSIESRTAISSATGVNLQEVETITVRESDYKLHWTPSEDSPELYNLNVDPGENNNIFDEYPDVGEVLLEKAQRAYQSTPKDAKNVGEDAKERLRDLGYL
jgi:arylsulfatase A-like enzyme